MVIFCTKSESKLAFRKPTQADFLGSGARRQFLMPRHEIQEEAFWEQEGDGDVLRKNDTERIVDWQTKSALGHWSVMRTVLPVGVWENW
jgi:hypothetical protein